MKILIIKRGATGDVVRTTTLLHVLNGEVSWITDDKNLSLINSIEKIKRGIPWSQRGDIAGKKFELVINLEDSDQTAGLLDSIIYAEIFGACKNGSGKIVYTEDSSVWFDISIISQFGKSRADELKFLNRRTYQELVFEGLGYKFKGETYFLPETEIGNLSGDIAIAKESGAVWPMKNWAYYDELAQMLKDAGYIVNLLPKRKTLLEHIADVRGHKYLISGDSLPMHIALGSGIKCLTLFICTSPWEIYDYGLQKKISSPNLHKYFYRRDDDPDASKSIPIEEVYQTVVKHIENKIEKN